MSWLRSKHADKFSCLDLFFSASCFYSPPSFPDAGRGSRARLLHPPVYFPSSNANRNIPPPRVHQCFLLPLRNSARLLYGRAVPSISLAGEYCLHSGSIDELEVKGAL